MANRRGRGSWGLAQHLLCEIGDLLFQLNAFLWAALAFVQLGVKVGDSAHQLADCWRFAHCRHYNRTGPRCTSQEVDEIKPPLGNPAKNGASVRQAFPSGDTSNPIT
jgi:hypothetical protein